MDTRARNKYIKQFTNDYVKKGKVIYSPERKDKGLMFCKPYKTVFVHKQHSCYNCKFATKTLDFKYDYKGYQIRTDGGWFIANEPDKIKVDIYKYCLSDLYPNYPDLK